MKALVAGATGRTGKEIVRRLVEEGVPVTALVRDRAKAERALPVGSGLVTVVEGDVYQYASLGRAFEGVNTVFCATGATDPRNVLGPYQVDYEGTRNLVARARLGGVQRFVLVTSIGADEVLNPLNLFWGVLLWKKRAEQDLQRSGLDYLVVRPGGLLDAPREGRARGNLVLARAGTYGLAPGAQQPEGPVLRRDVADVCVEGSVDERARNQVVEVLTDPRAPKRMISELFAQL